MDDDQLPLANEPDEPEEHEETNEPDEPTPELNEEVSMEERRRGVAQRRRRTGFRALAHCRTPHCRKRHGR